jgi:hypothetical protein
MKCWNCGETLGRARLVIERRLFCPDCVYWAEGGTSPRIKPPPARGEALLPQEERLFPLPPPPRKETARQP